MRQSTDPVGGYRFLNKGALAEVFLYGEIGPSFWGEGVTAKQFADDLRAAGSAGLIDVRINSMGGDVFDGLTIYSLLNQHPAKVVVHIDGMAASIASVIAMAGDEIEIAEPATMMVHNAWGGVVGSAPDLRAYADRLDMASASIRDVYVARTGRSVGEVSALMDAETWMTGPEAVASGFATRIVENLQMAARAVPAGRFRNAPKPARPTPAADGVRARLAQMQAQMQRSKMKG
jgi:ATP-dependent protease ClpP protease subunit